MEFEERQKALDEYGKKFENFKPETRVMHEDGSFRMVFVGELGTSHRRFEMVELMEGQEFNEKGELKTDIDLLSELLLNIERYKSDPKLKEDPVENFQEYPPQTRRAKITSLGKIELVPMKAMLEYIIFLSNSDNFFRTQRK